MSWFETLIKGSKYKTELMLIDEEISLSKRFGFPFALLVVDVSCFVPRGLSKLLPGKTLSFHILKKNLRLYDKVIGHTFRRYHIIFSKTDRKGAEAVKERILRLSLKCEWGDIMIGMAVFPEDGETANSLLTKANHVSLFKPKCCNRSDIQLTGDDWVKL